MGERDLRAAPLTAPLVRAVRLAEPDDGPPRDGYPWTLPAVAALAGGLALNPGVTYLIGENGSGKSTLLEAIAVAAGINPDGGTSNVAFATHSPLIPAYPHATIYACDAGLERVGYDEAQPVRLTRAFLSSPDRFLAQLLADG